MEQSKKLAEILPIESADMYYPWYIEEDGDTIESGHRISTPNIGDFITHKVNKMILPCWSLAALSEFILPYIADDDGNNYKFYLSKDGLDRWIAYYKSDNVSIHICEESDNMIDVILEMVCWLKEEKYI